MLRNSVFYFFAMFYGLVVLPQAALAADDQPVDVSLDSSAVPHLDEWAGQAKEKLVAWYPRVRNLLASEGFETPTEISLTFKKSDEGIAATSGSAIVVSSHWIEKHPDDFGLIIHELTHAVQSYPNGGPWWVTEGVADYIRWAVYEGKPQTWFPRPKVAKGYEQGYQVAGGFLLWLESGPAPGIVRRINAAMRQGTYSEAMFEQATGHTLEQLWATYVGFE